MAVETEPDEVAGTQGGERVDATLLWHVADVFTAAVRRMPADRDGTAGERLLAQDDPQEAGLAGPVDAEHGEELARLDAQVQVGPEQAGAEAERGIPDLEHRPAYPSAVWMADRLPVIQLT